MDMDKKRAWVFHPDKAPGGEMVYLEDLAGYLEKGWYDNPGNFPKQETDKNVLADVDAAREAMKNELLEGETLEAMTKDELNDYAAVHYPNVKITSKMSRETAKRKIEKAMNDNSTENH